MTDLKQKIVIVSLINHGQLISKRSEVQQKTAERLGRRSKDNFRVGAGRLRMGRSAASSSGQRWEEQL